MTVRQLLVHPGQQGTQFYDDGFDLAVLAPPAAAPLEADRYELFRETDEMDQLMTRVGWGVSGQGVEQDELYPGGETKRIGINRYERFDPLASGDIVLSYDFDSMDPANDYFGLTGGPANPGEGDDEVLRARGVSGGPAFIDGMIAGVVSYREPGPGGIADTVPGFNSSFGEFGSDTRVSSFADWIDDAIDPPRIIGVTVSGTITVHFNEDVNISSQAFKLTSALDCNQGTGVCETYPLDATFDGDNGEPEDGGGLDYAFHSTTGEAAGCRCFQEAARPIRSPTASAGRTSSTRCSTA